MSEMTMPFVAVAITEKTVLGRDIYGATCLRCGWEAERYFTKAPVLRQAKKHNCERGE